MKENTSLDGLDEDINISNKDETKKEKSKKLNSLKKHFTIKKVCINTTKVLLITLCAFASYVPISQNINNINALQKNYKKINENIKEIDESCENIKKENDELNKNIENTQNSIQNSNEKSNNIEQNITNYKNQVENLKGIVDKNATFK